MSYIAFDPNPAWLAPVRRRRSLFGLGDAAYDAAYAAYVKDLAKWEQEKIAYTYAIGMYNGDVKSVDANFKSAVTNYVMNVFPAYEAARAAYNAKLAAYKIAYAEYKNRKSIYSQQKAGYDQTVSALKAEYKRKAKEVATKYGLTLPSGFVCISPQAKAFYDTFDCTAIKGLGAYSLYGAVTGCAARNLPVCAFPPAPVKPPAAPAKPKAPTVPKYPTKGKYPTKPSALRAQPQPPLPPPTETTIAPPPVVAPPPPQQMSMVKGGIIAAVVVLGGVALYRTFASPKKAS